MQAELVRRAVPVAGRRPAERGVVRRGVALVNEARCSRRRRTGGRGDVEPGVVVGGEARCSRPRRTAGRRCGVVVGGQRGAVADDGR